MRAAMDLAFYKVGEMLILLFANQGHVCFWKSLLMLYQHLGATCREGILRSVCCVISLSNPGDLAVSGCPQPVYNSFRK